MLNQVYPTGIYLLKVKIETLEQGVKICSKLTIKIPERRHWQLNIFHTLL